MVIALLRVFTAEQSEDIHRSRVTLGEIKEAVKALKGKKSPGVDQLVAEAYQHLEAPELDGLAGRVTEVLRTKEGPYQDRPPLCPFRRLPLLIYSGSTIAFLKILKVQGPKSKNIEKRKYNPPSTLNSNQIPQIQQ